jgi:ABC-type arginine transport system ATPase subunit
MTDLKMTNAGEYMKEEITKWGDIAISSDLLRTYNLHIPKSAGKWIIGGTFHVDVTKKPTDEQIKNTEEMFGWEWASYD